MYNRKRKNLLIVWLAQRDCPHSTIVHPCPTLTPFYGSACGGTQFSLLVCRTLQHNGIGLLIYYSDHACCCRKRHLRRLLHTHRCARSFSSWSPRSFAVQVLQSPRMFGTKIDYFVVCNSMFLRAMCHNEDKYANASEFNPDRFLNPDGTLTDDTVSFVWGFGRRICPGRHLAEASIWSGMVCLLAVFNFSRAKDETGKEIEIEPSWNPGLTVCVGFNRISLER